jgi:sulfane dehydrogenase subunit SoxC
MKANRRQFLTKGTALAGLALGGVKAASAQTWTGQSPYMALTKTPPRKMGTGYFDPGKEEQPEFWGDEYPEGRKTPIGESFGIITPNREMFVANHQAPVPNIDAREHTLLIHGLVERPMVFTVDDIKRLPSVSRVHYLACAGNGGAIGLAMRTRYTTCQQMYGWAGCAEWTGVPLSLLFDMVGVKKEAKWIVPESVDGKKWSMTSPVAKAYDDAMVIYGQNGELLSPGNGYPLRLLVPGFEGTRNIKWLRKLKLTDQPAMSKAEINVYSNLKNDGKARWYQFAMEVGGIITFPSAAQKLPGPGSYEITGVGFSGGGSIHRVEVSVDGGKTWTDAQLQAPILRKAFTRFRLPWRWDGQEAVIMSRSTDDTGDIQPSLVEFSKLWNIAPEQWLTVSNTVQHFNAVQPWRIDRDGNVTNGMWHPSNFT